MGCGYPIDELELRPETCNLKPRICEICLYVYAPLTRPSRYRLLCSVSDAGGLPSEGQGQPSTCYASCIHSTFIRYREFVFLVSLSRLCRMDWEYYVDICEGNGGMEIWGWGEMGGAGGNEVFGDVGISVTRANQLVNWRGVGVTSKVYDIGV